MNTLNLNTLVEKYLRAKDAYYNAVPIISDEEFDALENQIQNLDPNNPALLVVGYSVKDADKVEHTVPMLSMEKAMKEVDLLKWIEKRKKSDSTSFVATNKLDGMSCELRYKNGVLEQAITRGDGAIGRNITAKLRYIVPNALLYKLTISVRGELLMSKSNLEALNKTLDEPLSNPRNGVGGVINEDAIDPEKLKYVEFKAFESLHAEDFKCATYQQNLELLSSLGFSIPHYRVVQTDAVKAAISHFTMLREQDDMLWDGVVFRVNDLIYANELGKTAKFWKRAVAYKFPTEMTTVTIKEIEWSIGTQAITPVAIFEPVFLSGANISRASLKSVKNMIEVGAYPGATVNLVRSGEVIPYIQRYDLTYDGEEATKQTLALVPETCSVCGKPTMLSNDYTWLRCFNPDCIGYLGRKVEKFLKALDVMHAGPAICEKLVDLHVIQSLPEILKVTETELLKKELGPKITSRLVEEIKDMLSRKHSEYKVLGNIGIYNVGEETAKDILEKIGSIDELINMSKSILLEKMQNIFPGIAATVCDSFQDKVSVLKELKEYGLQWESEKNTEKTMTVVITGTLEGMSRKQFQQILESNGVKMASAVSKNTDYLITNEISNSSKCKKAKALGVPIVNQHEFLDLL